MIQAITQNKARMFFTKHARRPREDIVTSCVFGILEFLPQDDRRRVLGWLLPDLELIGASDIQLRLWPQGPHRGSSEPDVLITWKTPDGGAATAVIEVKWGDLALTAGQALRQWQEWVLPACEQGTAVWHVLLVQYPMAAAAAIDEAEQYLEQRQFVQWRKCCYIAAWRDVAERLGTDYSQGAEHLKALASGLQDMLAELGLSPFRGFSFEASMIPETRGNIFFHRKQFDWSDSIALPTLGKDRVFFTPHGHQQSTRTGMQ